jgi:hypothetical protein
MSAGNEEVSEVLAAVLSFLIVGLGHVVINGQTTRGAVWFLGAVVIGFILGIIAVVTLGLGLILFIFLPLIPIGSAIDAYMQAQKINSGEIVV